MTIKQDPNLVGSEHMLDQIFSESHSFMTILSVPEYRYLRTNQQHLNLIRRTDIIGKTLLEVEPELKSQGIIELLNKVVESGETFVGTEIPIHYDPINGMPAKTTYLDFVYQPLKDAKGKVYAISAQGYDVTEKVLARKRAESAEKSAQEEARKLKAEQAKLSAIFYGSDFPLVLFRGPNLVYEMANDKYLGLIGFRSVLGKSLTEALPEIAESEFPKKIKSVYDTGLPVRFLEGKTPILNQATGKLEERYFDTTFARILDEATGEFLVIGNAMDVTEKVSARLATESISSAIQNERENIRNLFKQTPEMVCILKGPDHVFEFVNEAHIKALGFDATGMSVREAQPESVEVHGILDSVYKTGQTAALREIPVTLGDKIRYFDLTYSARRDQNGLINGIMILGTEITDQVETRIALSESREKYLSLFDYSPLPKWIIDIETIRFIDVNMAAVRHYGYSKEEFLAISPIDIRPEEEKERFISTMKNEESFRLGNQTYERRRTHKKKDGTRIEVEVSALDITLEGRRVRLCAIVDITDRVQAEARQNELLASLNAAKEEAEHANQLKSAFLANMSHEIRTPLGAMLGFSDLLKDPSLSNNERSSYVDILTRNGEQLSYIINDILDLSKVEAGHLTLEFQDVTPGQICAEVISLLSVTAKEKDLVLEYQADPTTPASIVSDPIRLRQILLNLVGNAIKFTKFGSVRLRSFGERSESGRNYAYFEVIDTGIGISNSQKGRLFEMFVQADGSMTRRFGGTGLGLALSRRLARELGGDVTIESTTEDKGSTFKVCIEDQPERRNMEVHSKTAEQTSLELTDDVLEGVRVLVVDDSPDNQQLLWHFLSNHGAVVDSADNGFLGYRKALSGNFDIVLMDIQMPEMDGYTATQKLRAAGFTKPIIALTAHAMSEVRKKCLNVGCSTHLPKPINPKELIGTVAKFARLSRH